MSGLKEFLWGTPQEIEADEKYAKLLRKQKLGKKGLSPTQQAELDHVRGLSRRLFVRRGVAVVGGLTLPGTISYLAGTQILPPEELAGGSYPLELTKYYPELKGSGIKITSVGRIENRAQIPTTIYNLTGRRYNHESAQAAYSFFEQVAGLLFQEDPLAAVKHSINGVNYIFGLGPAESVFKTTRRTMAITPVNAPKPSWMPNVLAGTRSNRDDQDTFTWIRMGSHQNDLDRTLEGVTTLNFAIEACNQVIWTVLLDSQHKPVIDLDLMNQAQDIVGNSYGRAVGARLLGLPYEKYADFMMKKVGNQPFLGIYNYRYLILPEQAYLSIPSSGPVIQ